MSACCSGRGWSCAIPDGAQGYSGYIYDKLEYVLGRASSPAIDDYTRENKALILAFKRSYRARAFADRIVARNDSIRIEVFRRFPDRFEVLMLFVDDQEQRAGIDILRGMGPGWALD